MKNIFRAGPKPAITPEGTNTPEWDDYPWSADDF